MNKFYRRALSALLIVLVWWGILGIFAAYRVKTYGVQPTFPYYNILLMQADPIHAVWAHFDGTHYLKIAEYGYVDVGTQAFFPVFPIMIHTLHELFGINNILAGRLISFVSLWLSIICMFYLFKKKVSTIILALLVFPTAYYLACVYTESIFLFETLLFFLLIKQKKLFWAAIVAGIASGTRIVGAMLMLSLFIELYPALKQRKLYSSLLLLLSLSGLLAYIYFLKVRFNDPIMFIHVQSMFGSGRTSGDLVMLPQVIYRYLRIFMTVPLLTFVLQRAVFEFSMYGAFFYLLWRTWRNIPLSWSTYIITSLMLPALSGTLSSIPRYSLVMFPMLVSALPLKRTSLVLLYVITSSAALLYYFSLYIRGVFVA